MALNPLNLSCVFKKLDTAQFLLKEKEFDFSQFKSLAWPKRDVEVVTASKMPKKKGLSYLEGKQRLLHDLASIELQAMELGLRTLIEFSRDKSLPLDFFEELKHVTYEEAEHCRLCINALKDYEGHWGMMPVHLGLWNVSSEKDSLLDRILKVHRYLEGSGLDASFSLLNRLKNLEDSEKICAVIQRIATDEIPHVQFGSKWFSYFCAKKGVSRLSECKRILNDYYKLLPRRREKINESLRKQAGFTSEEISLFREHQKTTSF